MGKIAFATTPPMDWSGSGDVTVLDNIERLVLRARATDTSIHHGEWLKAWKAVCDVMGNSEPTEVCDPNKQGATYLDALIVAMGGSTTSVPVTRSVFKLNGTNQYIDLIDDRRNGAFLFAFTFYGTTGVAHELSSHDNDQSSIRVSAAGELLVQIGADPLITIPSASLGDISTPKRIEIGRASRNVRVRVDGVSVSEITDHGNSRFGVRYMGANQGLTAFSDAAFYDIQFTNANGDHFYIADDQASTLVDTGTAASDGEIINYNQSGWIDI